MFRTDNTRGTVADSVDCRTPGFRDCDSKRVDDREAIKLSSYVFVESC
jgi:hypothetical protein